MTNTQDLLGLPEKPPADATAKPVETVEAQTKRRAGRVKTTPAPKNEVAVAEKPAAAPAPVLPSMMAGLPATDAAAGLLGIIERAAATMDVERMQALLDMYERVLDRAAKAAFTRDFAAMSLEMPRILKKGSVGYKEDKHDKNSKTVEAFKFAMFEDIDEVVRPILPKYGFAISFTSRDRTGGGLILVGTLSHKDGHFTTCELPLALDNSGGKNNLQGMGSTSSYGIRYAHKILLNLVFVGEDNDGNGDPPQPVTMEQAAEIDQALNAKIKLVSEEKRKDVKPRFLAYMGVEDVREITDYAKAMNAIKAIGAPSKATQKQ